MPIENTYSVKLNLNESNLNKKIHRIIQSIPGFEILNSSDSQRPQLLICEVGENPQKNLKLIQSFFEDGHLGEVFITSESTSPNMLMKAMRIGVKEFISQPISENEVRQALEGFRERQSRSVKPRPHKNGKIISIFGSKGGVGATTVAVNLAVSMAQNDADCSVTLLDMNTLFGEIPLFLEMSPKFHWGEITKNIERLDNTFLSNILTDHPSGIKLLPSPAYLNGHVRPTPEIMTRLLSLMKQMFDYIIVDGGQSTNDTSLKVLEISDTLLLITILSLPCLANTNKLLKSLTDLGYVQSENIKVVLNRRMKKGEISLKDAETGIGKELYWAIPNDFGTTMEAINNGKPLLDIAPKARVTKNIFDLANSLSVPKEEKPKKKLSLFKR